MVVAKEKLIEVRTHCKNLKSEDIAVQSLDYSGSVIDVSPAWLKLTGYERDEVIGRHFVEFLDIESLAVVAENFPRAKDYGFVDNVPLKFKCKDRKIVPVSLTGTSKYDNDGKFIRTFCEVTPKDQ